MNEVLNACHDVIALFVRGMFYLSLVIPASIVGWMYHANLRLCRSKEATRIRSTSASACTPDSEEP
jgi:hypothetical protein